MSPLKFNSTLNIILKTTTSFSALPDAVAVVHNWPFILNISS